jgi:aspartate/methionine/tyrosine aminotransferase
MEDPYDANTNPGGYVNLGTAENHLLFDAIAPFLREAAVIVEADAHYNELYGISFLREAVADFLQIRAKRPLSPEHIVIASGASAVLELLAFTLCDPGDAILIPTPYYPGFDYDLGLRSGAELVEVPLDSPDFRLDEARVEAAFADATSRGTRVRAVLLTSPHNPLGQVYDEALVHRVVDFATRKEIHVILDEIYAESLLPGVEHFSGLRIKNPLIHVVYGFAKDFGLSGYKVGILHSESAQVVAATQELSYFHTVSTVTQRMLAGLLRDPQLPELLRYARSRLNDSYGRVIEKLSQHGIPYLPGNGGIVIWIDLRAFLRSSSFEDEQRLWQELLDQERVSISPGQAFHCKEPGWFRLCFTAPIAHLDAGLERLGRGLTRTP